MKHLGDITKIHVTEPSPQTKATTGGQSSKNSSGSKDRDCQFLDLRSGRTGELSWETISLSHGGYSTASSGEQPIGLLRSDVEGSRLSLILEPSPPPKYSLSAKACRGILRRAERRGKKLPEILEKALRKGAGTEQKPNASEESAGSEDGSEDGSENCSEDKETCLSFQERAGKPGGGKGILTKEEGLNALRTGNQQSVCYGISSYDSNSMKSPNPDSGVYEADTSRCLDLNGGNPACNQGGMAVIEGNGQRPSHMGDGYKESEVSYTLNATEIHGCTALETGFFGVGGEEFSPPLKARDFKDPMSVVFPTNGFGNRVEDETANTITSEQNHHVRGDTPVVVDMGGGKSSVQTEEDKSTTLTTTHYGEPAVAYGYDPLGFHDTWPAFKDTGVTLKAEGGENGVVYGGQIGMTVRFSNRFVKEKTPTLETATGDNSLAAIECKGGCECVGFDPNACRDLGKHVLYDKGNTVCNGTNPGFHNGVAIKQ